MCDIQLGYRKARKQIELTLFRIALMSTKLCDVFVKIRKNIKKFPPALYLCVTELTFFYLFCVFKKKNNFTVTFKKKAEF